jgi:hypothetical protein
MTEVAQGRIEPRTPYRMWWGPLAGAGFGIPTLIALLLVQPPQASSTGAQVVAFYTDAHNEHLVWIATTLLGVSLVLALFFFGYVHARLISEPRVDWFLFAGSVFVVGGGAMGIGLQTTLNVYVTGLDPDMAQVINVMSNYFYDLFIIIGMASISLCMGLIIILLGMRPRVFGQFSAAFGLFLLANFVVAGFHSPYVLGTGLAIGVWVIICAIFLWYQEVQLPPAKESDKVIDTLNLDEWDVEWMRE